MTAKTLVLSGTCTGEYGEALSLMQEVKRPFDPRGLLNLGKVLPDTRS